MTALPMTRDQLWLQNLRWVPIDPVWLWTRSIEAVWYLLDDRQRQALRSAQPIHDSDSSHHDCCCNEVAAKVRELAARLGGA